MRTVFDNSMVAHVWAQQKQESGRSHNGQFYFSGAYLYSYGTHFVAGLFAAPGGPVFINSNRYSPSTGRHFSYAWAAVRHLNPWGIPGLTDIAPHLRRAGTGRADDSDRARLLRYLQGHWPSFPDDSEAAAWILRMAGKRGTWAAMRSRLASAKAKADRESAARFKASEIARGRELAAIPLRQAKGQAWVEARSFGQRELRQSLSALRSARLATPKAHKRIRAALWRQETALRLILASAERDSDYSPARRWCSGNPGNRTRARAAIAELRKLREGRCGYVPGYDGPDGTAKLLAALALPNGSGWQAVGERLAIVLELCTMPPAMRSAMAALQSYAAETAGSMESESKRATDIAEGRRAVRDELRAFNRARRDYARLVAMQEAGQSVPAAALCRALEAIEADALNATPWRARRAFELVPAMAERMAKAAERSAAIVAELAPALAAARIERDRERAAQAERERIEAARIAAMGPDEKRAAWQAGELATRYVRELEHTSGPLLRAVAPQIDGCRVMGGTLETSQGATVPLRHAFRVFQFVSICRAERKAWTPGAWGPAHIRVGHFTVDRIEASGDFRAGCHAIKWPEVESLAVRLGLADCLASLPEVAEALTGEAA